MAATAKRSAERPAKPANSGRLLTPRNTLSSVMRIDMRLGLLTRISPRTGRMSGRVMFSPEATRVTRPWVFSA
ncbi:hypothetical protein D3C86_1992730 [compost metagenome]